MKSLATRVVQNTAVLVGGRIANAVLGGFSSILIIRGLGSEQFGQFSSLYAFVSLFGWLATLGIESILIREASRNREQSGGIIATGMALCSGFALFATVAAVLVSPHAGYGGKIQLLIVFTATEILLLGPLRLPAVIFQVDLKQWYGTGITLVRQILWMIMIIALAFTKGSLTSFVLGRLAVATIETLLILIVAASFLKPPYQIAVHEFKIYLKASIPIALSMLLASVYLRIDQVMLHSLASDKDLGFYAAAVKVSELFELLPAALLASIFPILAINSGDEPRMAFYIDRIFRYLMASAGLLCTFVCVGAEFIVHTLYGAQFSPTAHLLSVLIWSEFAVFFGTAIANLLLARGLQNYLIYPTIGGAVVNVVLNLIWIRRYGASGSAWATLISYTFAWTVVLLVFTRTRTMVWQGLGRGVPVVLLSLFVSLAANYLPVGPVVRLMAATAIYLLGLGAIKTIKTEDLRYLRSALGPTLSRKA